MALTGMATAAVLMLRALLCMGGGFARGLPGRRFDLRGRAIGLKMLLRTGRVDPLLVNPVSSVRYFEFDFARRCLPASLAGTVLLDVSSPFLFGLCLAAEAPLRYRYVNPDRREQAPIDEACRDTSLRGAHSFECADARALPYPDASFDHVVTLSVVEHIDEDGDSQAMREMWRVLKHDGRLVLTVPVKPVHEEEYRTQNVYGLPVRRKDGRWFFQRYYDAVSVAERLRGVLGPHRVVAEEVWGERQPGFFAAYEQRWLRRGLHETVMDPWLMASRMTRYASLADIPGMAVYGLCLGKQPA